MLHQPTAAFQPAPPPADIAPAPAHPDAEILRLSSAIDASVSWLNDLCYEQDAVFETRFREPAYPPAAFYQRSDFPIIWIDARRLDTVKDGETVKYVYTCPETLAKLRDHLASERAFVPDGIQDRSRIVRRLEEIVAAVEAWTVERKAAWEDAGLAAFDRAIAQAEKAKHDMVGTLAAIPASTGDGVAAKVLTIARNSGRSLAYLAENTLPKLLADTDRSEDESEEMLLVSAMIDARRLTAARPSTSAEAA